MENTLGIIKLVNTFFVIVNLILIWLWYEKLMEKTDGICQTVVLLGFAIVRFALRIPILISKLFLEENYWIEILNIAVLVATIILLTLLLNTKILCRILLNEEDSKDES